MANKKKNVKVEEDKKEKKLNKKKEEKKENKKEVKKETKKVTKNKKQDDFDKLVEELEMENKTTLVEEVNNYSDDDDDNYDEDDNDEEYDDEDAYEEVVVIKKTTNNNASSTTNNTNNTLMFITCVSLCVSVVTLLISLVVLSKVSNINSYFVEDDDESTEVGSTYDTSMFTSLTEDDFISLFGEDYEDDEIRFVYSGRSTCSYCVAFLPYLQQSVEEYDYTLYYLDIDTVTKYDEIGELDDVLASNISYTPMVYAIKNGEVIDVNDGYTEYSTLTEFLEEYGVEAK